MEATLQKNNMRKAKASLLNQAPHLTATLQILQDSEELSYGYININFWSAKHQRNFSISDKILTYAPCDINFPTIKEEFKNRLNRYIRTRFNVTYFTIELTNYT